MILYLKYAWTHYRVDSALLATFGTLAAAIALITVLWYIITENRLALVLRKYGLVRYIAALHEMLKEDEEDRFEDCPDWASPKLYEESKIRNCRRPKW